MRDRIECVKCCTWFDREYNPADYGIDEGPSEVCPDCWDREVSKDD